MAGFGWSLSIGFIGTFAVLNAIGFAMVLASATPKRSAVPVHGGSQ